MKIWVDADACPVAIKEILFRAAERTNTQMTLIANNPVRVPPSLYIKMLTAIAGFDVADDEIVKRLEANDLVITSDIPLAAEVIEKNAQALNPRGELYSSDTISARLNMRDFLDTMRSSGINTKGPKAFSKSDCAAFANQLDKILCKTQIKP